MAPFIAQLQQVARQFDEDLLIEFLNRPLAKVFLVGAGFDFNLIGGKFNCLAKPAPTWVHVKRYWEKDFSAPIPFPFPRFPEFCKKFNAKRSEVS